MPAVPERERLALVLAARAQQRRGHRVRRAELRVDAVDGREQGVWVVFTAAFTPIPFKVFTVTAGVAKLDLFGFIAASAVGRGARFFLVAGIVRMMGASAKEFIDRYKKEMDEECETIIHGDSTIVCDDIADIYDAVFIDGNHSYEYVKIDELLFV